MFETLLQNIVSGVLVGSLYGLAALGLSLVFGVLRILNIAHGELIMLGGYAAFWFFNLYGIDPFVSLALVIVLLFLIGWILHRGLFSAVVKFDEEDRLKNSLLIGFGLTLILQSVAIQLFSADERSITTDYATASIELFGIRLPIIRLAGLVVGLIVVVLLELFLNRTFQGKAIRATAEDWQTAALTGINVHSVYLFTFALGSALAGVAGALVVVGFSVSPIIGLEWTLKGLIVIVLAGLGSMWGTFLGGILLGVMESLSAYTLGAEYRELVGIILFLIILTVRPQGLFGARVSKRQNRLLLALLLGALLLLPLLPGVSNKILTLSIQIFLIAALASSWNLLGGYAGQINLGHAAFFGLGTLTTRFLWLNGIPLVFSFPAGGVVAALFALIFGAPALRLKGIYFAIGTLALAQALRLTVGNFLPGNSALPAPMLASYELAPRYYLMLGVLVVVVAASAIVVRSKLGLGMMTVRENEEAAESIGVSPFRHKMIAFVLSAFLAGLTGSAFAYFHVSYYYQFTFTPVWTFDSVLVTFIGGIGTVAGPLVGAVFFVLIRDVLATRLTNFHLIIFGVIFIVVVLLLPGGFMELWDRFRESRKKPMAKSATDAPAEVKGG